MAGSYTASEQAAAKIASAIADGPDDIKIGVVTKATSSTTAVVAHGLAGTPTFVIASLQKNAGGVAAPKYSVNSTSVTFTLSTAQTTWSVAYVIGYKS